jgi:hypothetical protein
MNVVTDPVRIYVGGDKTLDGDDLVVVAYGDGRIGMFFNKPDGSTKAFGIAPKQVAAPPKRKQIGKAKR